MRRQLLSQQGNECTVAKLVLIRNAQYHHGLAGQRIRKFFPDFVGVPALHHEDDFGPAQMAGRHAHPRARLRAGRARFVVQMVLKKLLGREATCMVPVYGVVGRGLGRGER